MCCTVSYRPSTALAPDQLKLRELLSRLSDPEVEELVVATNPTLEGEATAMYIRRHLTRDDLRVTRLARGLPVGGSLEYTDETHLESGLPGTAGPVAVARRPASLSYPRNHRPFPRRRESTGP